MSESLDHIRDQQELEYKGFEYIPYSRGVGRNRCLEGVAHIQYSLATAAGQKEWHNQQQEGRNQPGEYHRCSEGAAYIQYSLATAVGQAERHNQQRERCNQQGEYRRNTASGPAEVRVAAPWAEGSTSSAAGETRQAALLHEHRERKSQPHERIGTIRCCHGFAG